VLRTLAETKAALQQHHRGSQRRPTTLPRRQQREENKFSVRHMLGKSCSTINFKQRGGTACACCPAAYALSPWPAGAPGSGRVRVTRTTVGAVVAGRARRRARRRCGDAGTSGGGGRCSGR
jgi:hypothetical protein